MGVIAIDPVEYGQLLANTRPKVIETETEFREARKLLESLTFADRELSPAELALRELLRKLVIDYDDRMHPLPKLEARKLLRRLLEQRELKQKEPYSGSRRQQRCLGYPIRQTLDQ
jgi:HTH-type transcriptional regulator/antitoxin HigA